MFPKCRAPSFAEVAKQRVPRVARAPQERLTDRKCWRESAVCESKPDAKGQRLGDLGRRVGISAIERKSSRMRA